MSEIINCLFGGMSIGFEAFFGALQVSNQLDGVKELLISLATGIPVIVISISFLAIRIYKLIRRF